MSELRQKVRDNVAARAGCKTPCRRSVLDCACLNTTDAAIALIRNETLEEAAKAAESVQTVEIDGYDFQVDGPSQYTIVDAIRALKDAPA